MTTPTEVNKALAAAGLNVKIVRNRVGGGYYYFIDDGFDVVPSIYSFNLSGYTPASIVSYVKDYMDTAEAS